MIKMLPLVYQSVSEFKLKDCVITAHHLNHENVEIRLMFLHEFNFGHNASQIAINIKSRWNEEYS